MKNQPFTRRLGFALGGLWAALRAERSFRTHVVATAAVIAVLLWVRPPAAWWAIVLLATALVLVGELINTAVEHLADHLHPELHPQIKLVKDYAAAAVLIASIGALTVAAAFAWQFFLG